MNIPDEAPKLTPWPFIAGDLLLLATAYFIASQARAPLNGLPLACVAACVICGALLAIIPFLLNYTQARDAALAERQNEIAALAQTTATSAEQLGIAVAGLNTIAELAAKNLKTAEHLPHKLQEKINEFKTQLNEVAVTENETLAQEINTLRTAETERLETALASIRKTAAEISAAETQHRKQLGELNDALARLNTTATKNSAALATAQAEAEKAVDAALARAFAALDAKIGAAAERLTAALSAPRPTPPHRDVRAESAPSPTPPATVEPAAVPPLPATEALPESTAAVAAVANPPSVVVESRIHFPPAPPAIAEEKNFLSAPADAEPKPVRKKTARKTAAEHELTLGLDLADEPSRDEFAQLAPDDAAPTASVSTDGMTRLIATAYIGIGNKLYLRGEGPGLSWDKGVPLQFVSIGKWRWETSDAEQPVTVKLFKNDEVECAAVGSLTLQPGHQHEVRAAF